MLNPLVNLVFAQMGEPDIEPLSQALDALRVVAK
jgi:hypothetical protein